MNIFKNNFLIKLIATLCLFLALISFAAPTTVQAEDSEDDSWGGVLITPVVKLLTALGDGIMELLHSSVQSQHLALIKIDGSEDWKDVLAFFGAVLVAIIVAVAVIAASVASGGAAAWIAGKIGVDVAFGTTITLGLVAIAGGAGTLAGIAAYDEWIPDDIYLPAFSVTAEEIFSNKIPLFDVNFFDTSARYTKTETVTKKTYLEKENIISRTRTNMGESGPKWAYLDDFIDAAPFLEFWYNNTTDSSNQVEFKDVDELNNYDWAKYYGGYVPMQGYEEMDAVSDIIEQINVEQRKDGITDIIDPYEGGSFIGKGYYNEDENEYVTCIKIVSTEGNIRFTINYSCTFEDMVVQSASIKIDREAGNYNVTKEEETAVSSTAQKLRGVVSKWYFILRNLAFLILMVVLIYIGIRIVLASTAGDKAKYKERIIDWIVAMCLLFVMNYIMVFSVELVDRIIDIVKGASGTNGNFIRINLTEEQYDNAKKIIKDDEYGKMLEEKGVANLSSDNKQLIWVSDLAGLFRLQSQLTNEGTSKWVGYSFSYVVLVFMTLFFAWTYLKRIVYMAFLTMIAPLVAMTYPIDKISDGKAQAFNAWLKEYIFNLLIQPMHLLLYSVLVSSAYELASESAIYALVALGFMMPAEKLIRKFFGFEKASTPGLLGGAAGAALAMSGINKLLGHKSKGGSSGGKNSGENESKDSAKINFKSKEAVSGKKGIAGEPSEDAQQQDSEESKIRTNGSEAEEEYGDEYGGFEQDNYSRDMSRQEKTDTQLENGNAEKEGNDSPKQEMPKIKTREQLQKERNQDREKNITLKDKWKDYKKEKKQEIKDNFNGFLSKHPAMKRGVEGLVYNHPHAVSHIKGTMASTGAYKRALRKRIGNKIQNGHPIRAMARGAAGLAGAAAFGAAGLAMGVVSGDPSKAFQYASAGTLGGYKLSSSTVGAVQKATSVDEEYLKEQYEMAAYGDEYKKHKIEEEKKKMQENEKYINYLQKTMSVSRDRAEVILKETGGKCFDSGITNVEDIATIEKMRQDGISINEAIGAKKFNDLLPSDVSKMSSKKREEYINTWKEDYEKAGYGSESENWAKKSMDYAIKYADTQSSLKKSEV